MEKNRIKRFNENSELNISDVISSKSNDYHYTIKVNGSNYGEAFNHQELIEFIEQIRVERGEGAKYKIELYKV